MSESSLVPLVVGFILCATGSACPIELNPSSVVVKFGDAFSVNCSTSLENVQTFNWEHPIGSTERTGRFVTWIVPNVNDWDINPICYISEMCSKNLPVTVYRLPDSVIISSPNGPSIFNEGEKHILTCEVQNIAPVQNLSISWYRGDEWVATETFIRSDRNPFNQTSTIPFTPTRNDNGIWFKCEAIWDLPPEIPNKFISEAYNITVHFGPDINCSEISVVEGESLEGLCSVTGNPSPRVTWLRSGTPWDTKVPVTREDKGLFAIRAEGNANVTKVIRVSVLYGPEIDCPNTYSAVEHTAPNLSCNIAGFPAPTVTWYKDGEETYLAENLTRSDAGQYTIMATNAHRNTSHSLEIVVLYAPSRIFELEDTDIDVGSSGGLKCSSSGHPRPQYSWLHYQADNVLVEHEDGVSRLQIHNATGVNIGTYTCRVWNDIGSISKTVRVQVKGAKAECPVEITPKRMVVNYHESHGRTAICKPANTFKKLYWEVHNANIQSNKWIASQDWNPRPRCVAEFNGLDPCYKSLDFTMYRMPDKVDLLPVDHVGPTLENKEYQFQCNIFNVAPIHNLTVTWYLGNETIVKDDALRWTPHSNDSDITASRMPVNVSSTINITLDRNHSSLELRCEAQLNLELGPGQQPSPVTSMPHVITVYYKPVINTTILPTIIPVFRGYPVELKCEAEGHPSPTIHWFFGREKEQNISGGVLVVYEAGNYTCKATNNVNTTSIEVEVILKEDYLPLIAGLVAVTVVIISVIFIFIYSIYYKNTKMRRYSLKNPKLNTQNGNIAHNNWDTQLPMTKLS